MNTSLRSSYVVSFAVVGLSLAGAFSLYACSSSSSPATIPGGDGGPAADGSTNISDGATATDASAQIATACAESAKARCLENDTCSNGTANQERFGAEPTCESRLVISCEKNLAAPGTGATATTVESCATTIPTETCSAYRGNDPAETCVPPVGTVAAGGACGASAQCESTYCAVPAKATCGTCAAPPAVGNDCTLTQECGARGGLICALNNLCVQEGAAAATCSKDAPCGPDLTCVIAKAATTGTCTASIATVGGTCDPLRETAAGCDAALGLYCDPTTSLCVAYTFAAGSAACGQVNDGLVACTNGECVLGTDSDGGTLKTGTCTTHAADNAACDPTAGSVCQAPAKCIITTDGGTTGTCQIPDPSTCQ